MSPVFNTNPKTILKYKMNPRQTPGNYSEYQQLDVLVYSSRENKIDNVGRKKKDSWRGVYPLN